MLAWGDGDPENHHGVGRGSLSLLTHLYLPATLSSLSTEIVYFCLKFLSGPRESDIETNPSFVEPKTNIFWRFSLRKI